MKVSPKVAEHFVSQAIDRLSEFLNHEAARRVRANAEELRGELKQIRRSLAALSESQLKTAIDVANEVCDAIDSSVAELDSSRVKPIWRRIVGTHLSSRIKSIRAKIGEISVAGGEEAAEAGVAGRICDFRDGEDEFFVGLDESIKRLMGKLMEDDESEDRPGCISIVGMGGIGKTALAKYVYGHSRVRQRFECFAWAHGSYTRQAREILYDILVQVGFQGRYRRKNGEQTKKKKKNGREVLKGLSLRELVFFVRDELEAKRYLVVLDDMWAISVWDEIEPAFPQGNKGSRIVLTSRSLDLVHRVAPQGFVLLPVVLSVEESFLLVVRKAFSADQTCPPEIMYLLKEVLLCYCRGLPLIIILVAGLLRARSSVDEWKEVLQRINSFHDRAEGFSDILAILTLCYEDLPWYLTPCFLYFASFPENQEILKEDLIRYWIAEGFVPKPKREGETMEGIAEGYLRELVNRCLVQVGKRDHTGVGIETCQMHGIVLDKCLEEATQSNFFNVVTESRGDISERRIVVQDISESDLSRIQLLKPYTRSLLWFNTVSPRTFLNTWTGENFRLLRVLEVGSITGSYEGQPTTFPGEIGYFTNLRYLGLRGFFISQLPSSIGKLRYLQILDLRNIGITELPSSIGELQSLYSLDLRGNELQSLPRTMSKLTCLRHLLLPALKSYVPTSPKSARSCFRMDKLRNLHTLKLVQAGTLIRCDAVQRLTNIRNLKIEFRSSREVMAVLASPVVEQNRLQSLTMSLISPDVFPSLDSLDRLDTFPSLESLSRCYNLRKLGLHGRLSEEDISFLPKNLNKLLLSESNLMQDPMSVLQKLQNLRFLRLGNNSYNGREMDCSKDGFPMLETLQLVGLSELREWRLESGSMPSLSTLDIENTRKLRMLPEELKFLPSLQDLTITDVRETAEDEPEVVGSSTSENVAPARRLRPAPTFTLNVGSMPPTISVHLIVAEISSAVGY